MYIEMYFLYWIQEQSNIRRTSLDNPTTASYCVNPTINSTMSF